MKKFHVSERKKWSMLPKIIYKIPNGDSSWLDWTVHYRRIHILRYAQFARDKIHLRNFSILFNNHRSPGFNPNILLTKVIIDYNVIVERSWQITTSKPGPHRFYRSNILVRIGCAYDEIVGFDNIMLAEQRLINDIQSVFRRRFLDPITSIFSLLTAQERINGVPEVAS